jgi:hypothetical protein
MIYLFVLSIWQKHNNVIVEKRDLVYYIDKRVPAAEIITARRSGLLFPSPPQLKKE